jgi:hypothetical protein
VTTTSFRTGSKASRMPAHVLVGEDRDHADEDGEPERLVQRRRRRRGAGGVVGGVQDDRR